MTTSAHVRSQLIEALTLSTWNSNMGDSLSSSIQWPSNTAPSSSRD
jgi:hypothetical protein